MDVKKTKELAKLVSFCRKSGIASLKMDGIEITFHQSALFPESKYKQKKADDSKDHVPTPEFTDEETLFWSASGLPEQPEAQ